MQEPFLLTVESKDYILLLMAWPTAKHFTLLFYPDLLLSILPLDWIPVCFKSSLQALLVVYLGNGRPQHAGLLQNKTLFAFTYYLNPEYHSGVNHGSLQ